MKTILIIGMILLRRIPAFVGPISRRSFSQVQAFLEGGSVSKSDVRTMKVKELKSELEKRNLNTTGLKRDLVERLVTFMEQESGIESHKETTEQLDPKGIYVLQTKGISSFAWDGTGVGIVLQDGNREWTARKFLPGNRSVFEAEYTALIMGIRYAARSGAKKIILQIDNDVITKQLNGDFQVTKASLKPLYWNLINLKVSALERLDVQFIHRKDNGIAHELAGKALALGKSVNIIDDNDPMSETIIERRDSEDKSVKIDLARKQDTLPIYIDPNQKYLLQFDGGARGNPKGTAGIGMVIYDEAGQEVWCGWRFEPDPMSNNAAEYHALLTGLKCAKSLGIKRIRAEGDSNLIVKQVNGIYQVKDENLKILWKQTVAVIKDFEDIQIAHIRREVNRRADWLANQAMDTKESYGFHELA